MATKQSEKEIERFDQALFNQAGLQVQVQQAPGWRRALATVGKKP